MGFQVLITRPAQTDLDEIFYWYDEQKDALGFLFLSEFDKTIANIRYNPFFASIYEENVRIASLKRFPYYVVYRILTETCQCRVIAIIHQHRNPKLIQARSGY